MAGTLPPSQYPLCAGLSVRLGCWWQHEHRCGALPTLLLDVCFVSLLLLLLLAGAARSVRLAKHTVKPCRISCRCCVSILMQGWCRSTPSCLTAM